MRHSGNIKILLIILPLVLFPVKGYSWWLIPGAYYAQLNASTVPSGAGSVYVDGDAGESEPGRNAKHTDNGYQNVNFNVRTSENGGYTFQGWSNNESGSPLLSTDREYTTAYYRTSGTPSAGLELNASQYYIYAIYSAIPYTLQLLPGDHGQGTQQNLNYDAQSTDNLQNHLFTAEPGYQFKDWKVTVADGYWTPVGKTYNTGTALSAKYGSATLTAEWSAKSYNITYNANGGKVNNKNSQTDTYNIESAGTVRTPTRTGHTFSGWKVTSVEDEGNWVLNQIIPVGTSLSGKYGKVTLTALWDISYADITITVSGMDSSDSAIYTISSGGTVLYTVVVPGNSPSVTVKDLPTGVSYDVNPKAEWNSWEYDGTNATETFALGASGHTSSFTYTKKSSVKKHDEKSNTNWKPQTP